MTQHGGSAGGRFRSRMAVALAMTATYMVAEIIGGIWTRSLALLADAAHMATDVAGLTLALFAIWIAQKPVSATRTYGYYRAEILGALLNGVILFGVAFYILYEAYQRFNDPVEVKGLGMLLVAAIGLIVNLISMFLLKSGSAESLNVKGAYLEVLSDMLGSVGVIVAAGLIWLGGWNWVDPLISVLIGFFILPRTWLLMREAVDVLMEAVPRHLKLEEIEAAMRAFDSVSDVHDLHVWTLTSGKYALSSHLLLKPASDSDCVIQEVAQLLKERYGITHTTLQVERRIEAGHASNYSH